MLRDHVPGNVRFDERFAYLFNSYYEAEGERHPRPRRGMLSRPSLDEVRGWRAHVDEALDKALPNLPPAALALIELGINHEQQHQELFLTDILATFAENPLEPAYARLDLATCHSPEPLAFLPGRSGLIDIGAAAGVFAFDSERPRHQALLRPHAVANRPVTNGEWADFIADGGYSTPGLWLSEGWDWVQPKRPRRRSTREVWHEFTRAVRRAMPRGARAIFPSRRCVRRWAGARQPTSRWENFAPRPIPTLQSPGPPRAGSLAPCDISATSGRPARQLRPYRVSLPRRCVANMMPKFMFGTVPKGASFAPRAATRASARNFSRMARWHLLDCARQRCLPRRSNGIRLVPAVCWPACLLPCRQSRPLLYDRAGSELSSYTRP